MVVVLCLADARIFAGCVLAWCLSFGRTLLAKAQEERFQDAPRPKSYPMTHGVPQLYTNRGVWRPR
jgi:hypothetical protein